MNNHQTWFISGLDLNSHSPDVCYDKALENIENHYSLIGVVERFDESLLLLARIFGFPDVHYVKRNLGIFRPSIEGVADGTIERIMAANELDIKLHHHAIRLLEAKIEAQGKDFGIELKGFRRKQAIYYKAMQLLSYSRDIASALLPGGIKRRLSAFRTVKR